MGGRNRLTAGDGLKTPGFWPIWQPAGRRPVFQ